MKKKCVCLMLAVMTAGALAACSAKSDAPAPADTAQKSEDLKEPLSAEPEEGDALGDAADQDAQADKETSGQESDEKEGAENGQSGKDGSGTDREKTAETSLADVLPLDFEFSSGAGGWGTTLTLNRDGTFEGSYHDSEMGDMGEDYPDGTVYICEFEGNFTDIEQIDENTYSMKMGNITLANSLEEMWIEDGIRYVAAEPYGLESGEDFIFYMPDTPTAELSEEFLSWWPGNFMMDDQPDTLSCYGIFNEEQGYGFFTYME